MLLEYSGTRTGAKRKALDNFVGNIFAVRIPTLLGGGLGTGGNYRHNLVCTGTAETVKQNASHRRSAAEQRPPPDFYGDIGTAKQIPPPYRGNMPDSNRHACRCCRRQGWL